MSFLCNCLWIIEFYVILYYEDEMVYFFEIIRLFDYLVRYF